MDQKNEAVSVLLPCDHSGNPASFIVGRAGVTRIVLETQDHGDHAISLVHIYKGSHLALSAPLKAVAFVEWKT